MLFDEWKVSPNASHGSGMTDDEEELIRNEMVTFMTYYGIILRLNRKTISEAILIFHRYSKQVPFRKFDRYLYASACIFLTAKLHDHPLGLNTCIRPYVYLTRNSEDLDFSKPDLTYR